MATGLRAFKYLQISNPENTPGTAEAATEILYPSSVSGTTHDTVWFQPNQDRNNLALHVEDQIKVSADAMLEIESEIYDRMAVFAFSNAIRGNVTATQPDNINKPNNYEWDFTPSLNTTGNTPDETNGIDTFTVEFGDNVQDYEGEYAFTESIEITGTPNEPVTMSWSSRVRQVTTTTKTAALSDVATAHFATNKAQIYIDSTYAGIGTTAVNDLLLGFTWTFETGFTPRYTSSSNLYYSGMNEDKKAPVLEMTFRRDDTNSEAEKTKFLNGTTTYIRIALVSDTEMDSGENNPEYIYLDGAYQYTEWNAYEDDDGINTVTVTATGRYDATASKMMGVTVGTTMSAFA